MLHSTYSIGLDFGTLSGRAVLIDHQSGREIASCDYVYPHAVMEKTLPGGDRPLPEGYALHHPQDYLDALPALLKGILEKSGVDARDITGIGVDTTATTIIPLDDQDMPLCFREEFRNNPHAWIKLWKHHTTQPQADRLNALAQEQKKGFLQRCGGKVSAEWYWPKVMEIAKEAPEVYENAHSIVELADWIAFLLTHEKKRCQFIAAFHAHDYQSDYGMDEDFLRALDPLLIRQAKKNQRWPQQKLLTRTGGLQADLAARTGLIPGTAVAVACTDSPIAMLSMGITREEDAVLIMGTSGMLMFYSKKDVCIPGAMGTAENALLPGHTLHLFGQSAVGDIYQWFVNHLAPHSYYLEAQEKGESIYQLLNRKIAAIPPDSPLPIALDWMNGNRCLLQNANLSGVMAGLTLSTTADQIYRALIEATAFGLKKMLDAAREAGVSVKSIRACGGIAYKSPEIMQIYADILELPISTSSCSQPNAQGSAIMGAMAAGSQNGGYDDILKAVAAMQCPMVRTYQPCSRHQAAYRRRYRHYCQMHQHFGVDQKEMTEEIRRPTSI